MRPVLIKKSLAEEESKTVDIFIQMRNNSIGNGSELWALINLLEKDNLLDKIDLEYCSDGNGHLMSDYLKEKLIERGVKYSDLESISNNQSSNPLSNRLKIRLIDSFPVSSACFSYLLGKSENLIAITGDQSMTEAISSEKLMLYEIMNWKKYLAGSILEFLESNKLNNLAEFYQLQFKHQEYIYLDCMRGHMSGDLEAIRIHHSALEETFKY